MDFCRWSYVKPRDVSTSAKISSPRLHRSFISWHRTSPQFSFHSFDLKEVPLTRRRFPRSRVRRGRREMCAQLRGCNPRHDETSIVITELSGKPPLRRAVPLEKQSRRMQTAYLPPNATTMTSAARHVPERVNSYVSPLNYETPFLPSARRKLIIMRLRMTVSVRAAIR